MSGENTNQFDASKQISIKLQSSDGEKTVLLRFPTDAEWIDRQSKRKVIIKFLGRQKSETRPPDSSEADLQLVAKLRMDGETPGIDGYEATQILDRLSRAEVENVEAEAGAFRVTLRVPGALTTHLLGIPSAKELMQYRRAYSRYIDLPYNQQELTINLGAAGDLYKKIHRESAGYAGEIPIVHQAIALKALLDAIESGTGAADEENF